MMIYLSSLSHFYIEILFVEHLIFLTHQDHLLNLSHLSVVIIVKGEIIMRYGTVLRSNKCSMFKYWIIKYFVGQ